MSLHGHPRLCSSYSSPLLPHVDQDDGDRDAVKFSGVGHEAPFTPCGSCSGQEGGQNFAAPLAADRDDIVRHYAVMMYVRVKTK